MVEVIVVVTGVWVAEAEELLATGIVVGGYAGELVGPEVWSDVVDDTESDDELLGVVTVELPGLVGLVAVEDDVTVAVSVLDVLSVLPILAYINIRSLPPQSCVVFP